MFHNHSREDTLGPKWPLQQPNSTDSLFHPDICLSSNKRLHREPQFPVAGKKSPKKVIGSQRETPRRSVLDTSAIDEKGSYYLSKRYGPEIEKEDYKMRTRGKSLSLLDSESAKKKEKREKEESSQPKSKYKLQVKIEGLKSLIKTEKEMMLGLKKKISSEKSELSLLQQKLDAKKSKSKYKKTKELRLNKSAMALVHDIEDLDESVASKRPPVVPEKILQKRSSAAFQEEKSFDKSVSIRTRDSPKRNSRLSIGRSDKENYDLEKRTRNKGSQAYEAKMGVLEDSIKQLKSKYEEEITGLRGRLEEMRNENLKLKETTTYEKGYERIQILQSKRLQDLTETLGKKERELIVQERYYKEQIDTMARKVIMLNDEMEKAMQKQEKIKELKSQIQNKNTDIEITKQYFVEKLKSNLEDHYNQKKEWSNVQNDLVRELQSLKVKENVTPPFPTVSYVTEHKYKGKGSRI